MSPAFYRPTGGFFERIHPATKLIGLVLGFIPPFLSHHPLQSLPYFILLVVLALMAGAASNLRRLGAIMAMLFVMSVVMWSLFLKGSTVLTGVGPIRLTAEGLRYGVMIGIRLNCFILATVIFLTCTRIEDVTHGLSRLGVPFVVSFTVSLAFRLTPLFIETGRMIVQAQTARGLDLNAGGPAERIRRHVPVIVPVLVSGLRRADRLAMALESKGFGKQARRTVFSHYAVTWRDGGLLAMQLAIIALAAWWGWRW